MKGAARDSWVLVLVNLARPTRLRGGAARRNPEGPRKNDPAVRLLIFDQSDLGSGDRFGTESG